MGSVDYHYFATLTRTGGDAGTDSVVNLIVTSDGTDIFDHRFEDSRQEDQERGKVNLYKMEGRISDATVRVGILGDDAWEPELLFLWSTDERADDPSRRIVPLKIETDVQTKLSTNDPGAAQSMPIRSTANPELRVPVQRLLLIVETVQDSSDSGVSFGSGMVLAPDAVADSGTDDEIRLQVVANGALVLDEVIGDTPQDDLEPDQVNIYFIPVAIPFTREGLEKDAIRLSIRGSDAWRPRSLFVFGLFVRGERTYVMPLVHEDPWVQGSLSTDSNEGQSQVILPLEVMPSL